MATGDGRPGFVSSTSTAWARVWFVGCGLSGVCGTKSIPDGTEIFFDEFFRVSLSRSPQIERSHQMRILRAVWAFCRTRIPHTQHRAFGRCSIFDNNNAYYCRQANGDIDDERKIPKCLPTPHHVRVLSANKARMAYRAYLS